MALSNRQQSTQRQEVGVPEVSPSCVPKFTLLEKAQAADREVKQRHWVYPKLIARGKLTAPRAAREIAIMSAIAADYHERAKREDELPFDR